MLKRLWCWIVDHHWKIDFEESRCLRCGQMARDLWWWPRRIHLDSVAVKDRIKAAAILRDGRLWTGLRHHLIMREMVAELGPEIAPINDRQGFITEDGRFVDREEAAMIAFQAGQIGRPTKTLFSEDLFKN